jgi:APA family basic amino acid/polyamine antiporter
MQTSTLRRQVGPGAAIGLVVGQVIAVGIFLTPGTIVRTLASPALALGLWAITGLMAACGAVCYGALAARYPEAGGGYVYLREAYGPQVAFLYGWKCFLIMDPGITAALATGLASYAVILVPLGPLGAKAVAVGAIATFAFVHVLGVAPGMRVLTVLSALKISLLVALVGAAAVSGAGDWGHFVPFAARRAEAPPIGPALAGAFVAAFFSFGGWWDVTKVSGEVRDPARTVPRALTFGLLIVTLLYAAATCAFLRVVPIERVLPGEAFAAQVGTAMFGPAGGSVVAAIVVVCVAGSLAAMLMVAPRVYFAMARDGVFPAAAARLHPRFDTPVRAILANAVLASLLVLLGTFDTIVAYFIFVSVAFVAATVGAVIPLRRRDPSFRVPGYPWTPIGFFVLVAPLLLLLALNSPRQAMAGVALVLAGVPVYYLMWRTRPLRAAEEPLP